MTLDRTDQEPHRGEFAKAGKRRGLAEVMKDADLFIGLSVGGVVSKEMIESMVARPIVFALANPVQEILPEEILKVRSDAIIATGGSDYPNQVNNVLGFPFIFRGALDVGAKCINEEMKLAAIKALASLAKDPILKEVLEAYNLDSLKFGPDYFIPKPLDPRVLLWVASQVAKAAIDSGVAMHPFSGLNEYKLTLQKRISLLGQKLKRLQF
ncbi:MAG: malic enzyme-like NAD(P)-binding protein [Pseudomonadota bacterium]